MGLRVVISKEYIFSLSLVMSCIYVFKNICKLISLIMGLILQVGQIGTLA